MLVRAIGRPDVDPFTVPRRIKHDIAYFMTPSGERTAPVLAAGEYWIALNEAESWLSEGVLKLVSPLDSRRAAEAEITEDQERLLQWLVDHKVQHVRLED